MQVKKQQLEPDMEQQTGSKLGEGKKKIVRGVQQGRIFLFCLFNLYAKYIMLGGIIISWNKISERNINNLK